MLKSKTYFSPTRISVIALFSALAGVLYVFGFPIAAIFPSWLELNFSDIPALIGTFALGPVAGSLIVLFKILIKLIIKGTTTVFVGELADLLIGLAFVLPAGIIYKRHRSFKGALVGMAVGTAVSVAVSILANFTVLVPYYVDLFFGSSWDIPVGIMQGIFGEGCTEETFYNFYLWASVLPFNVMRCLIAILVTLPIYKHISRVINRLAEKLEIKPAENQTEEQAELSKAKEKKRLIITICVCVGVGLLLVGGVLLRYFLA
ncbi:MAG: ECF transporter S component [Candidatus Coproplasma sp.]